MSEEVFKQLSVMRRVRHLMIRSVRNWVHHRGASKGAALAFYTLFSIAPVLVFVVAIAGLVFGEEAAQGALFQHLKHWIDPVGAQTIQQLLVNAHNPKTGIRATIIAFITLLVGATSMFVELQASLDDILEVPREPATRKFLAVLLIRARAFGLVLVLSFMLILSLGFSAVLAVLNKYWAEQWATASMILLPISTLFSFGSITGLFAVVYKMLPKMELSWRDALAGAVCTALLFMVGKYAAEYYLSHSGLAHTYGAAGAVVAVLLWMYYSAQIFFLGAVFTQQYALWFGSLMALNPMNRRRVDLSKPVDQPEYKTTDQ